MARVFVSYRWDDSPGHAGRLYDRLKARFQDVYFDAAEPRPGADVGENVRRELANCDAFVAVVGPRWEGGGADNWARRELELAREQGIRVFVALVAGLARDRLPAGLPLPVPEVVELPESYWDDGSVRLVAAIEQTLAEQPLVPHHQAVARSMAAGRLAAVVGSGNPFGFRTQALLRDDSLGPLLASLPAVLREKNYDPRLLVVTARVDDALESAFRDADEELELVTAEEAFAARTFGGSFGDSGPFHFGSSPSTTLLQLPALQRSEQFAPVPDVGLPRLSLLSGPSLRWDLALRLGHSDLLFLGVRPRDFDTGELLRHRNPIPGESAWWVAGVDELAASDWVKDGAEHVDAELPAYGRALLRQVQALPAAD